MATTIKPSPEAEMMAAVDVAEQNKAVGKVTSAEQLALARKIREKAKENAAASGDPADIFRDLSHLQVGPIEVQDYVDEHFTGSPVKKNIEDAYKSRNRLLTDGYDKMAPAERAIAQNSLLELLRTHPAAAQLFETTPPGGSFSALSADQRALLENMLKDSAFREQFRIALEETKIEELDGKSIEERDKELAEAQKEQREADRLKDEANTRHTRATAEVTKVAGDITTFDTTPVYRGGKTKKDRLNDLIATQTQDEQAAKKQRAAVDRLKDEVQRNMDLIKSYQGGKTPNTAAQATVQAEITRLNREIAVEEPKAQTLEDKNQERVTLKAESEQLQLRKKNADDEERAAKGDLDRKTDDFTEAVKKTTQRTRDRDAFGKRVYRSVHEENSRINPTERVAEVYKKAGSEYLQKRLEGVRKAQQDAIAELEKEAAEKGEPVEQLILKAIEGRWQYESTTFWRNRETVRANREQIDADYARLIRMRDGGPDAVVANVLLEHRRRRPGDPVLADLETYITAQRAAFTGPGTFDETRTTMEWYQNNKGLAEKTRGVIGQRVIFEHIQHGGKVTTPEAERIFNSSWGREAMTNALNQRREFRELVSQMASEGVYGPNMWEWMKKRAGGNVLTLLLLILGVPLAGVTGLMYASEALASKQGSFARAA